MLYDKGKIETLDKGVRALFGLATFGASGAITAASTVTPGFTLSKPAGIGLYRCTLTDPTQRILDAHGNYYGTGLNHGRRWERRTALSSGVFDFALMSDRTTISHRKAADGAANTATAEYALGAVQDGGTIRDIYVIPDAAISGHATDYATLTFSKRTSAGASQTTVATIVTNATPAQDWTALARKAATVVSNGDQILAAGAGLTLTITKAGSGVQLPALTIGIVVEGAPVDATSGDTAELTLWVSSAGTRV